MHHPQEAHPSLDSDDTGLHSPSTGSGASQPSPACADSQSTSAWRVPSYPFDLCEVQPNESVSAGALHSSLFMWPVVLKAGFSEKFQDRELAISAQSTRRLAESVKDLAKAQSNVCLLRDLFAYSFVACNGPLVYHEMLEQMAARFQFVSAPEQPRKSIDVERFESGIYEDAPTLHFVMGTLSRVGRWPELGGIEDTTREGSSGPLSQTDVRGEMALILNQDLGMVKGEQDCVLHAGEPDFAAFAIESGIKCWLTVLHDSFPFDRWEALPQADDRVDLCIALRDTQRPFMYIPLRTYQLGVGGVQRVLVHMAGLADMAEGGMQNGSIQ